MVHLHLEDGTDDAARAAVVGRWQERFGTQAWVLTREEAVGPGLFGEVSETVLPRSGDVIVAAHGDIALFDGRRVRPQAFGMVGQHGSWTKAERQVPLVAFRARGPLTSKRRRRG